MKKVDFINKLKQEFPELSDKQEEEVIDSLVNYEKTWYPKIIDPYWYKCLVPDVADLLRVDDSVIENILI